MSAMQLQWPISVFEGGTTELTEAAQCPEEEKPSHLIDHNGPSAGSTYEVCIKQKFPD